MDSIELALQQKMVELGELQERIAELENENKRIKERSRKYFKSLIEPNCKSKFDEIQSYFNIGAKYGFVNPDENDYLDYVELANCNLLYKINSEDPKLNEILKIIICKYCNNVGFKMHSIKEKRIQCLNCPKTRSLDKTKYDIDSDKYYEIKTIQLLLERITVNKIAKILGKAPSEVKKIKLKHLKFINDLIGNEIIYSEDLNELTSIDKKFVLSGVNNLNNGVGKMNSGSNNNLFIKERLNNNSLIKINLKGIVEATNKRASGIFLIEEELKWEEKNRKGISTIIIVEKNSRMKRKK